MEFPIKFDTVKSGLSIVHVKGTDYNFIISTKKKILFLKSDFVLANSAVTDEMWCYAA